MMGLQADLPGAFEMKGNGKGFSGSEGKIVMIAVKASREIPRAALLWALTHVVQPGDCIELLAVIPPHSSSKQFFGHSLHISIIS